MRNRKIGLVVASVLLLSACGGTSESSLSSSLPSSSSTTIEPSSSATSSSSKIATISLASVRAGTTGQVYTVEGTIVAFNYTGQTTPYIVGYWLADSSDSLYVYDPDNAPKLTKGNHLILSGTKSYYIPTNDTNAAAAESYAGMLQLASPTILFNDEATAGAIPEGALTATTIAELASHALTDDISGKIYKVKGRYTSSVNSDFTNYTFTDLNRVDNLLAYTQSNGKDYAWTADWVDHSIEATIIISLAKPSVKAWRFCPVALNGNINVTPLEECQYGVNRAFQGLASTYDVDTTLTRPAEDPLLPGLIRTYTSKSTQANVTLTDGTYTIAIKASPAASFALDVSCVYQEQNATGSFLITTAPTPSYDTITLADARNQADGSVVTVEAMVARVTYKGSLTPQGLFLSDSTGSLFAYNGDSELSKVANGNKVVIKGTLTHYIKNAANATAESYSGDLQIANFSVLHIDANTYNVPEGAITVATIAEIVASKPSTNISSNLYRVKAKVYKNTGTYPSYSLEDYDDNTIALPLYSQNSGADFAWLDDDIGKNVTILVGIQNLNLKSANSNWRGVPLVIEGVLA